MTHWHVRSINKRVRDRRVTYPFVTNWRGNSWGIRFSVPELTLCLAALLKVLSNFDHLALVKAVSFSSAEKNDIWWKKFGKHVFVQWLNGEHLQIILSSVVCSCFFGEMIEGTELHWCDLLCLMTGWPLPWFMLWSFQDLNYWECKKCRLIWSGDTICEHYNHITRIIVEVEIISSSIVIFASNMEHTWGLLVFELWLCR